MTDFNSAGLALIVADEKIAPGLHNTQMKCMHDSYTLLAELTTVDEILLNKIPEGAKIVDAYVKSPDLGTTGVIQLGMKAHLDVDGNSIAEDADALVDLVDATNAVLKRSDENSVLPLAVIGKGGAQPFINCTTNTDVGTGLKIEIAIFYMLQN